MKKQGYFVKDKNNNTFNLELNSENKVELSDEGFKTVLVFESKKEVEFLYNLIVDLFSN